MSIAELAVSYAALILADDGVDITVRESSRQGDSIVEQNSLVVYC